MNDLDDDIREALARKIGVLRRTVVAAMENEAAMRSQVGAGPELDARAELDLGPDHEPVPVPHNTSMKMAQWACTKFYAVCPAVSIKQPAPAPGPFGRPATTNNLSEILKERRHGYA